MQTNGIPQREKNIPVDPCPLGWVKAEYSQKMANPPHIKLKGMSKKS